MHDELLDDGIADAMQQMLPAGWPSNAAATNSELSA